MKKLEITNTVKYKYKKLILVEFHNCRPFLYEIKSNKGITLIKVADYFIKNEDWDDEKDSITFIDDPITDIIL